MDIYKLIKKYRPFIRYCIVGSLGTFIDIFVFYVAYEILHFALLFSAFLSFMLAVINNFLLNKNWTFQNRSKNSRKQFVKFFIVSCVGLCFTLSFMYLFVEIFEIWSPLAKAITSLIVLSWNFLGNKYWTFSSRERLIKHLDNFDYELSIVVPAYNEENRIKSTLLLINNYLQERKIKSEILVVDDGSRDKTSEVVNSLVTKIKNLKLVFFDNNHGKGFAVKKGVEKAKGKYILFADADNSTPIEDFSKLEKNMKTGDFDICIGSRYTGGSEIKIKQPTHRFMIGRIGNLLINMFLVDNIRDTQCGFKLFKSKAAKEIFARQKVNRFGFDIETLVIAQSMNYKISETPVSWFNSVESRFRPIKDVLITLKDLIFIKLNLWSGRYY